MKKKARRRYLGVLAAGLVIVALGFFALAQRFQGAYQPNVNTLGQDSRDFFIPTGSSFNDVLNSLYTGDYLIDTAGFKLLAVFKKYDRMVKPGKYELKKSMTDLDLIELLKQGKQNPIAIKIKDIITVPDLASIISQKLEADSSEIVRLLNSKSRLAKRGLDQNSALALIISDTYNFFWSTTAEAFVNAMESKFDKFWDVENMQKAKAINLTPKQVMILAAIVQGEVRQTAEAPKVAGVYLNRLQRGIKLEADATLKYIEELKSPGKKISRVYLTHADNTSPYNTYKYPGLPPGMIMLPERWAVEGVLNAQKHDYIFYCAKADLSGYHNFSETLSEHNQNARAYQNAMNKRGIK